MNKLFVLLSTILLLGTSVARVDIDYSGAVDSFTGEPSSGYSNTASGTSSEVPIDAASWFDRTSNMFYYKTSTGAEISSDVADGMMVTGVVKMNVPEGIESELYIDGNLIPDPDYGSLVTPGAYVLNVINGGNYQQVLKFTILKGVTGEALEYRMPNQFVVKEVTLDGVSQDVNPYSVDLTEEGEYKITYYCVPAAKTFFLSIITDHTPPELALEAVENGIAKGPVDISDSEKGSVVSIQHDGKNMAYTSKLTESGSYVISITDEAGNTNIYKFMIQVYFNFSSFAFFGLTIAVFAAIIIYVVYTRKKLRVR